MKFKFTQRELRMLIGLLIIAAVGGFYQFAYVPLIADRAIAQDVYDDVIAEEQAILSNILSKEKLKEKIDELKQVSKALTKQLPPQVDQEYIVIDVLKIFENNNTELLSFGFDGETFQNQNEGINSVDDALALYEASFNDKNKKIDELKNVFNGSPTATDEEETLAEEESPVKNMSLNVNCRGLYGNIRGVIKQIGELDNVVIVKNITVAKDQAAKEIVLATITLEFPYYPDNSHYVLEEWEEVDLKDEETDPFNYYIRGSQLDPNIPRTAVNTSIDNVLSDLSTVLKPTTVEVKSDFYISARPKASDDFAFTISKSGDARNRLHSDLENEELALTFTEIDGKTTFLMGTTLRPITEISQPIQFTPLSSKINVKVVSQPRVGDKDLSKGILRIANFTSKEVVITISNDDTSRPRITVLKEGNVTVK